MNEKLQYASMLDIPVNSCNIAYKPIKKRKIKNVSKKTSTDIKQQVMDKVNQEETQKQENISNEEVSTKKTRKLSIVSLQLIIIGVLIATIFLTTAFYPESGLNAFFSKVFKSEEVVVLDERVYTDFAPTFNASENCQYEMIDGVATMSNKGSVYSSLDGTIKSITFNEENQKYSVEVSFSENFSSKLEGLDFVYGEVGQSVYKNIPVGFAKESGSTVCFIGESGAIISNYEIVDGAVVWAV